MKPQSKPISRRRFLGGGDHGGHCISSAVVTLLPGRENETLTKLAGMAGVEVCAGEGIKHVVLLEGPDSGAVGGLLAAIAVMDGVISANMAFEHSEKAGA
jgi:nitrate reductase NapD